MNEATTTKAHVFLAILLFGKHFQNKKYIEFYKNNLYNRFISHQMT